MPEVKTAQERELEAHGVDLVEFRKDVVEHRALGTQLRRERRTQGDEQQVALAARNAALADDSRDKSKDADIDVKFAAELGRIAIRHKGATDTLEKQMTDNATARQAKHKAEREGRARGRG